MKGRIPGLGSVWRGGAVARRHGLGMHPGQQQHLLRYCPSSNASRVPSTPVVHGRVSGRPPAPARAGVGVGPGVR